MVKRKFDQVETRQVEVPDEVKYLGLDEINAACDRFLMAREPGYAERKADYQARYGRGKGKAEKLKS